MNLLELRLLHVELNPRWLAFNRAINRSSLGDSYKFFFIFDCNCRYSFQIPESWTVNGEYRSLNYMRPLGIWAMQWALDSPKKHFQMEPRSDYSNEDDAEGHATFSRVANFLRLPEERAEKSNLRVIFDIICEKLWSRWSHSSTWKICGECRNLHYLLKISLIFVWVSEIFIMVFLTEIVRMNIE